ncbi:MAG: hypothetical protein ACE5OR_07845 [bacterium]
MQPQQQEYWFSEGFTGYFAFVISVGLGLISEKDFFQNLERTYSPNRRLSWRIFNCNSSGYQYT